MKFKKDPSFPPSETVMIDDITMKCLRKEGMEIRKAIEKSSEVMFRISSENEHKRCR